MTNLVFYIRHGENYSNIEHQFSYKIVDRPLTDKGILQAQQTGQYLKNYTIDAIYSSPMIRTKQTANIIAKTLDLPVTVLEEFREIDVGTFDGRNFKEEPELVDGYFNVIDSWKDGKRGASFPKGEDNHTLVQRFKEGLRKIVENTKEDSNIIIVAHGGIFQHSVAHLFHYNHQNENVKNCSINKMKLSLHDGTLKGKILAWNYTEHLEGKAAEFYVLDEENRT